MTGAAAPPSSDRTVKCELVERLPDPLQPLILGGSRAQRFEPAVAEELNGLPAFNFAVQNSRPEDALYDGAHVQAADARRILAKAVKDAPAGVR